jgi:hypothetical protein
MHLEGRCYCGAVRYVADAEPFDTWRTGILAPGHNAIVASAHITGWDSGVRALTRLITCRPLCGAHPSSASSRRHVILSVHGCDPGSRGTRPARGADPSAG